MILRVRIGLVCLLASLVACKIQAATALSVGTSYAGSLTVPGQTNTFTFTGSPGQRLFFDSLDSDTLAMTVTLFSPGGVVLYQRNDDDDAGPWMLTEPGTYTLSFSGANSTIGNFAFRLLDLATGLVTIQADAGIGT